MKNTSDTISVSPPSAISGPAQGVRLSTGQRIEMLDGAAAVPSETTMIDRSLSSTTGVSRRFSPVYSRSQRSEPAGDGTAVSAPTRVVLVSSRVCASNPISL